MLARGAAKIIIVSNVEDALALRSEGVGHLCMGEVGGRSPFGFDALQANVQGMTVIQRTSAGTQGLMAAKYATQRYAGALVTAKATARAVLRHSPAQVMLVAMGEDGVLRADEDELCAIHL